MRKIYTEEFRKIAVDLSYNSDKPLTHLCKELGLSDSLLYKCRKDMKELNKKLENLEVGNQILKKALAICQPHVKFDSVKSLDFKLSQMITELGRSMCKIFDVSRSNFFL